MAKYFLTTVARSAQKGTALPRGKQVLRHNVAALSSMNKKDAEDNFCRDQAASSLLNNGYRMAS